MASGFLLFSGETTTQRGTNSKHVQTHCFPPEKLKTPKPKASITPKWHQLQNFRARARGFPFSAPPHPLRADSVAGEERHASVEERLKFLEQTLGDSADRHSQHAQELKQAGEPQVRLGRCFLCKGHGAERPALRVSYPRPGGSQLSHFQRLD